jgi:uncharacterized protein YjbI with pentapeptide repeats
MGADLETADFKDSNLFLADFTDAKNITTALFYGAFMDDRLRDYIRSRGGNI